MQVRQKAQVTLPGSVRAALNSEEAGGRGAGPELARLVGAMLRPNDWSMRKYL